MSEYKNISPSKKLRSVKRLLSFIIRKSSSKSQNGQTNLQIVPQQSISIIQPIPAYQVTKLPSPELSLRSYKISKLHIERVTSTTVPPRTVYHPNIISACSAMFCKHPSKLTEEEFQRFNYYKNRKINIGEPIEEDIIYLPIGGIRTCLNCGELTWTAFTLMGFSLLHIIKSFSPIVLYSSSLVKHECLFDEM